MRATIKMFVVVMLLMLAIITACGDNKPTAPEPPIVVTDSLFVVGDYYYFVANGINGLDTLGCVRYMVTSTRSDSVPVMYFAGNPDSTVFNAQEIMIIPAQHDLSGALLTGSPIFSTDGNSQRKEAPTD
jgi:hypothetical protein